MRGCDVAVIGGGIVGRAGPHALARRSVGRVAVLERGPCGGGSTSKATGGIRCQFGSEVNVRLSLRSLEAFRTWTERFGGDVRYRPVGYVFLATTTDQLDDLLAGADLQRRLGARVEVWDPEEARRQLPGVAMGGVVGATHGPDDGLADPVAAAASLLTACRREDVEVREHAPVEPIGLAGGPVA